MFHCKGVVIGAGGIAVFVVTDFFEGTFISWIVRDRKLKIVDEEADEKCWGLGIGCPQQAKRTAYGGESMIWIVERISKTIAYKNYRKFYCSKWKESLKSIGIQQ